MNDEKPKWPECSSYQRTHVVIRHETGNGVRTHTTTHPNLLSPTFFGDGRNASVSLTRPGYFANEIGAA